MKKIKACLSHNTDDWKTPTKIYNYFIKKLNCIDCFKFRSKEDELHNNYYNQKLFINPPFSKMNKIYKWIINQAINKNEIFLLIPARTDTKYSHELIKLTPEIIFIKGRLHYNDSKSAPFPTILMHFHKTNIYHLYGAIEQEKISE